MSYEPLSKDEAFEQIAVGVHTGLRKGSDAPSSATLWRAISESDDGAWADAVKYCLWGLDHQGLALCRKVDES